MKKQVKIFAVVSAAAVAAAAGVACLLKYLKKRF